MTTSVGITTREFAKAHPEKLRAIIAGRRAGVQATAARPAIAPVNALFRARASKDLNDDTSREIVGLEILLDAIARTGSTKAEAIRKALIKTDVPGNQTTMPWRGLRFDERGG